MAAAAARLGPRCRGRSPPRGVAALLLLFLAAAAAAVWLGGAGPAEPPELPAEPGPAEPELPLLLMFWRVERSPALRARSRIGLRSLLRAARLRPGQSLHLHLVSEPPGRALAQQLIRESPGAQCKVIFHDVAALTEKLAPLVEAMQQHFSAGSGTYYSDSIFFLSVAMHRILPADITRIIQLDLDLLYKDNIRELFEEFDRFLPSAVIGIAREMQPVYRHTFWQFRRENPKTMVGEPPPDGLPGFNSGVLLLNLEAMRQSELYNQLLEPEAMRRLADKYHFKGHLGDQDFFTLIGMEHPELFHVLDCTWNRQLCTWWRDHGYSEVFDRYFQCDGHVKIYHGNCNTPIPEE
uniref:Xyloside xylosyltransferase 1 n=1 Tax=Sphenodon punctatus TaxID=8508 RepID=A0A8D0LBB0_SPHPU